MVASLFQFVLDLCLLRRTPADAPAQSVAVGLAAALYLVLATLGHGLTDNPLPPLLPALQSTLLLAVAVSLLLQVRGLSARTGQTLFSLYATACLLGSVGLLLQWAMPETPGPDMNPLLPIAWLALFAWGFIVDAHILRHALAQSLTVGLVIAVLLFAANQLLLFAWYLPAGSLG
jgi:hypothetical protein